MRIRRLKKLVRVMQALPDDINPKLELGNEIIQLNDMRLIK
jgi:hypothetical protein